MNIRKKFKDMWKKLSGGKKNNAKARKAMTDSELSVEEVVHEEIFPEGKRTVRRKLDTHSCAQNGTNCRKGTKSGTVDKKPPSKRTRPTNNNYRMIDPDDDTVDTGKS